MGVAKPLEIPRIQVTVARRAGWRLDLDPADRAKRCTHLGAPEWSSAMTNGSTYMPGEPIVVIPLPGEGPGAILVNRALPHAPADGFHYPLVTRTGWRIRCLSPLAGGTDGVIPNDSIDDIRAEPLAGEQAKYLIVMSVDGVDATGDRTEVEIRIRADSMASEDGNKPGRRIARQRGRPPSRRRGLGTVGHGSGKSTCGVIQVRKGDATVEQIGLGLNLST